MTTRKICLIVLFLCTASIALACGGTGGGTGAGTGTVTRPANLDLAATRTTDQGLFDISYTSELDPPTINTVHTWTVHVATPGGQPVDGARVTVEGGMPEHNHGMPTAPLVTPTANGDYRVEGMKFQMPGWWTVTVHVTAGDQQDQATFNLLLQ